MWVLVLSVFFTNFQMSFHWRFGDSQCKGKTDVFNFPEVISSQTGQSRQEMSCLEASVVLEHKKYVGKYLGGK